MDYYNNVLGQSTKKGNFDPGLADRVNKRVAAKNRQKKLEAKKKKTEPKQEQDLEKKVATTSTEQLKNINGKVHLPPGKYKINFEIKIPKNSTLTITPGTELYLAKGVKIINHGDLLIKGTEKQKTIITAQNQKKGWNHIKNQGYLLIEYAKISHGKGGYGGGAIYNMNKADIIDSELENNHAIHGGAIYNCSEAELNIQGKCTFKNNQATNYGGAIYNEGKSTLNIEGNNMFKNNKAIWGGAIRDFNGTVNIKGKNTFKNNQAKLGGAISWRKKEPKIDRKTIYDHNTPNNVSKNV